MITFWRWHRKNICYYNYYYSLFCLLIIKLKVSHYQWLYHYQCCDHKKASRNLVKKKKKTYVGITRKQESPYLLDLRCCINIIGHINTLSWHYVTYVLANLRAIWMIRIASLICFSTICFWPTDRILIFLFTFLYE